MGEVISSKVTRGGTQSLQVLCLVEESAAQEERKNTIKSQRNIIKSVHIKNAPENAAQEETKNIIKSQRKIIKNIHKKNT